MNTTIIDLTEILNADVQSVSYGLLLRAVFHCIGAPLCKLIVSTYGLLFGGHWKFVYI